MSVQCTVIIKDLRKVKKSEVTTHANCTFT